MASNLCLCWLITNSLLIAFAPSGPSCVESHAAEQTKDKFVIQAKVVAMTGGCNAVKCPDIQYKLATTKIVANSLLPQTSPSEVSVLRVCGPSGLILGGHYEFSLKDSTSVSRDILNRPMAEGGADLECNFIFFDGDVKAAQIKYWE